MESGERVLNQAIQEFVQLAGNERGSYREKVPNFKEVNLSFDVSDYHTIHQFGHGDIYVYENDQYYFLMEISNLD